MTLDWLSLYPVNKVLVVFILLFLLFSFCYFAGIDNGCEKESLRLLRGVPTNRSQEMDADGKTENLGQNSWNEELISFAARKSWSQLLGLKSSPSASTEPSKEREEQVDTSFSCEELRKRESRPFQGACSHSESSFLYACLGPENKCEQNITQK